ncbi:hypothetical protein [Streptomyces sp. NPDC005209]|uniref:hypothetical protein n=1 Tax=Streptomyces sp. NPDC005209 TaxID=3156715 RepID=UPI0033B36CD6
MHTPRLTNTRHLNMRAYQSQPRRQRRAHRVTRLIVAADDHAGNVDVIAPTDIEADLGVRRTTAGKLRREAVELLTSGYDPTATYVPQGWR